MSVRLDVRIHFDDGIYASDLVDAINKLLGLVQNSCIVTMRRIGLELGLPPFIIDAATWRALTAPEGLLLIESIEQGSIDLKSILLTTAISVALTSTIGESLSEGWKKTQIHHAIEESIPKIEEYFVQSIKNILSDKDRPVEPDSFEQSKVAITREEDWNIKFEIRKRRRKIRQ